MNPLAALLTLHLYVAPLAVTVPLGDGFKLTVRPGFLHAQIEGLHVMRGSTEFMLRFSRPF